MRCQDSPDTDIKQGDTKEHSKGPFSEMESRGESWRSLPATDGEPQLCHRWL